MQKNGQKIKKKTELKLLKQNKSLLKSTKID